MKEANLRAGRDPPADTEIRSYAVAHAFLRTVAGILPKEGYALPEPLIRPATRPDLASLLRIQSCSPEAAQWTENDYERLLGSQGAACCLAAEIGDKVAGFLVYQTVAAGEMEVLNLAVDPALRRQGIGKALLEHLLAQVVGEVFLEVRAGNSSAQRFYREAGFREVGRRPAYYRNPSEAAIVMRKELG